MYGDRSGGRLRGRERRGAGGGVLGSGGRIGHNESMSRWTTGWLVWAVLAVGPGVLAYGEEGAGGARGEDGVGWAELFGFAARDYASRSGVATPESGRVVMQLAEQALAEDARGGGGGGGDLHLYRLCARAAAAAGDAEAVGRAWERVLRADGSHVQGLRMLARLGGVPAEAQPPDGASVGVDVAGAERLLAGLAEPGGDAGLRRAIVARALVLDPLSPRAARLAYDVLDGEAGEAERQLRFGLRMLHADPMQARLAFDLGALLDRLSLHAEAMRFYRHGLAVHARTAGHLPVPSSDLLAVARSQHDARDWAGAAETIQRILVVEPLHLEARLLLMHVFRGQRRVDLAQQQIGFLREQYDRQPVLGLPGASAELLAQWAWFFTLYDPDVGLARALSARALEVSAGSERARIAAGFVHLLAREFAAARDLLGPLSGVDQYAAWGYARALSRLEEFGLAREALVRGVGLKRSGVAYEQLLRLADELGVDLPAGQSREDLQLLVAGFPAAMHAAAEDPGRVLGLELRVLAGEVGFGEPMVAEVVLSNRSDALVRLGGDGLAQPRVMVSAALHVGQPRTFNGYVDLLLDGRALLEPGSSVVERVRLDVGEVWDWLAITPGLDVEVRFSAVLDPVTDVGGLRRPGPRSVTSESVIVRRRGVRVGAKLADELLQRVTDRRWSVGHPAVRLAAGLVLQRRLHEGKVLSGAGPAVDDAALHAMLRQLLMAGDSGQRASVLSCGSVLALDEGMLTAAARGLGDADPRVRMLLVHMLGMRQGAGARAVLERVAEKDADAGVRRFAGAWLEVVLSGESQGG